MTSVMTQERDAIHDVKSFIGGLIFYQGGDLFFNFWVVSHTGCKYNLHTKTTVRVGDNPFYIIEFSGRFL